MNKISDIAGTGEPSFPETTFLSGDDKRKLLNKELTWEDYAIMEGKDGSYMVVKVTEGKETYSFSIGSKAVMDKLKKCKEQNKFPAIGTFTEVKSKDGRMYYDIQ